MITPGEWPRIGLAKPCRENRTARKPRKPRKRHPPKLSSRCSIEAALLINNCEAYVEAAPRGCWVLYRINCLAAGRYYIGISGQVEHRISAHLRGPVSSIAQAFTYAHGVGTVDVLALFDSREIAEQVEWAYWQRRRCLDGPLRVGGFSPAAEFSGMGHA